MADTTVDNGQHILIGAYRDTLALMRKVGVDEDKALLRLPLTLRYPDFQLHAPRLPAPLHLAFALLTAQGLTWSEKLAAIRFMQWLKKRHFTLDSDCTVNALLDAHAQPEVLRRYLWEPLCISALNTPATNASAQVFANVLRDSLAADRAASDLLIPRVDLSAMLAEPAAHYMSKARGGKIKLSTLQSAASTRCNDGSLPARCRSRCRIQPCHRRRRALSPAAPAGRPSGTCCAARASRKPGLGTHRHLLSTLPTGYAPAPRHAGNGGRQRALVL